MDTFLNNPWFAIPLRMLIVVGFMLSMVPVLVWLERRVLAMIQVRKGPNRVGPAGLFQPVADGIKLFFKEDVMPEKVDRLIYFMAPAGFLIPVLCAPAVIPWGPDDRLTPIADINIGILFLLAMTSLTVYGIVLAGWSSNNKYSLLGALRASAQTISYELAMALSVLAVVLLTGSLSLREMVLNQQGNLGLLNWHLFSFFPLGLIATGIFLVAMLAETNRAPFDLPEAESELIAGYHTEYSSMKFAMFFMGEYVSVLTISSVMIALFFGGWLPPLPFAPFSWIPGPIWFLLKLFTFVYLFIWVRATFPRLRYDMLMKLGWLRLLPTALVNLFLIATLVWWTKA